MFFFFFNDTATTEIYTLSLHDALPIWQDLHGVAHACAACGHAAPEHAAALAGIGRGDRKSTRLNSSHVRISYAVFCLKKKNNDPTPHTPPGHHRTPRLQRRITVALALS